MTLEQHLIPVTLEEAQQLVDSFNAQFNDTKFKAITIKAKEGWYVVLGRRLE